MQTEKPLDNTVKTIKVTPPGLPQHPEVSRKKSQPIAFIILLTMTIHRSIIDNMINVTQIPSTYKLTINEGLDEAMDMAELRRITERLAKGNNSPYKNTAVTKEGDWVDTLNSRPPLTDLLDRAYKTVRSKPPELDEDEISDLTERGAWNLLNAARVAVCYKCGNRTTYEGESKVMCWDCAR